MAGIGGGGVTNLAMITVSGVVSLGQRGFYQDIIGAALGMTNAVGPFLSVVFIKERKVVSGGNRKINEPFNRVSHNIPRRAICQYEFRNRGEPKRKAQKSCKRYTATVAVRLDAQDGTAAEDQRQPPEDEAQPTNGRHGAHPFEALGIKYQRVNAAAEQGHAGRKERAGHGMAVRHQQGDRVGELQSQPGRSRRRRTWEGLERIPGSVPLWTSC